MRYKYLDYSKGVGILLIMIAHCIQYFPSMRLLNGFICCFHVPLFFIISGIVVYYNGYKKKFDYKKRARRLLIPWIIFSSFNSLIKLGVLFITNKLSIDIIHAEIKDFFILGNGTVWFLRTLFLVEVIVYHVISTKIGKSRIGIVLLIILFVLIPYLLQNKFDSDYIKLLLRLSSSVGYYLLGLLFPSVMKKINHRLTIGLLLITFGGITFWLSGDSMLFMKGNVGNFPSSLLICISSCLGLICIMTSIVSMNWLEYLGKNSIIIMLIHPTLLLLFTYPLAGYFQALSQIKGILCSLLLWVVIVLLDIPFIEIINRKCPWLVGK